MAFTHARLRRPARDGGVALHCAEAPPLAPPESTRRHWSHASLRRMTAVPTPAAGGLVLSHLLWEASCCLFSPPSWLPHGRRQSEQRRARAYCPVQPPSAASRAQTSLFSLTLKTLLDTHVLDASLDAPTTRANWTEILLPALKRPLPTSLGGWRGLEGAAWAPRRAAPTPQQPNKEPDDETQTRP